MEPEKQRFDITAREAANRLGVTRQTVKNMIDAGKLEGSKIFDASSNVEVWMVDSEEVRSVAEQKNSRTVAGYSDGAIAQTRETLSEFFGNLQNAIEKSTELERQRLEVDRERLEIDRQMTEEIQGLREEVRQRMSIDKELLEEQKKSREAIEVIQGFKEEGGEEQKSFWRKLFGG